MTLWRVLKTWWVYRRLKAYGKIGDYLIVPEGAVIVEKKPGSPGVADPYDLVHTIGWKVKTSEARGLPYGIRQEPWGWWWRR